MLDWARPRLGAEPILISSTADPADVKAVQDRYGRDEAGLMVERLMGEVAQGLAKAGVTRFVVAGGETSGAVVDALGVSMLEIGPEIDPGVPWTPGRRRQALCARAEVRQFRHGGLLHEVAGDAGVKRPAVIASEAKQPSGWA